MTLDYRKPCTVLYAAHFGVLRRASDIRHVVVHSTEGGTAESVAHYFAGPAQASTQLVVDDTSCYRCVRDLRVPWGAPGVNRSGVHVELCGWSRWTRDEWLTHSPMLRRAAYKTAVWAWLYKIPRRWLTPEQVAYGVAGFLRHVDASRAFHTPGGHSDPGEGFPRDVFMRMVREEYAAISEAQKARR